MGFGSGTIIGSTGLRIKIKGGNFGRRGLVVNGGIGIYPRDPR